MHVCGAVAVGKDHHIGQAVVVVHIRVKVTGFAGHGVEQQVFSDGFLLIRNLEEFRLVRVHRLVHAFDELGNRHDLANIRTCRQIDLQLINRFEYSRILDGVWLVAFNQQVNIVRTGHAFVELFVSHQQRQIRIEVFFQRTFNTQLSHTGQCQCNQNTYDHENFVAVRADQGVGVEIGDAVPEALFALHAGFFFAGSGENRTQRGNESHLYDQHAENTDAGKNTEHADGHNVKNHQ